MCVRRRQGWLAITNIPKECPISLPRHSHLFVFQCFRYELHINMFSDFDFVIHALQYAN